MSNEKAAFRQQLNIIRDRFISEARTRLDQLLKRWRTPLHIDTDLESALEELFRHAHNFTGSGASFGLNTFSESARLLEYYVQSMIDGGSLLSETQQKGVLQLLQRLGSSLENAKDLEIQERNNLPLDAAPVYRSDNHNRRLFLVEDDPEQASELALQLSFLGYEVFSFLSPKDACVAIEEHQPAVMLMDIVFPEGPLAGPQALKALDWPPDHIPIIFLSVRRDFESRLAALRAGGNYYLSKPIDIRKLAEILTDITSGRVQGAFRVLLVDDEPQEAALHSLMLEQGGMITSCVHRPSEVLAALERFRPDLILMDLYMPQCDGAELAALLRQHESHATTPIIFLSSEERFEKKLDAMRVGGEDFLTKPVGSRELVAMVQLRANRARQLHSLTAEISSLLRDYENQKQALDEHLPMMITDMAGRVTYANTKMLTLIGISLGDFLGTDFKQPPHRKAFPDSLWHGLEEGRSWQGKIREINASGEFFWLALTVVPARDASGKVFSYMWLGTDITGYKHQRDTLELSLVRVESTLKTKRDLLTCTSHEMRSSLNGLAGMARLLRGTELSQEQKDFVESINTATNHLIGIINQTLDFAKIEAGKLDLEQVSFPLRRCLEDVGELMAAAAGEKHLELAVQIHPDVPENIMGDPLRLRQILINLVGNAVKFTETGTVLLKVYTLSRNPKQVKLCFQVTDTGIGIPRNRHGRLFRFFSQAEASISRRFGGTGLGLAISSRLVEAMDSKLELESEEGKGSCFHFQLACAYKREAPEGAGEMMGFRVLLVCKDEATTIAIAQNLEFFGCRFSMAQSELQAWSSLSGYSKDKPFDSILYLLEDREKASAFARRVHAEFTGVSLLLLTPFSKAGQTKPLMEAGFQSSLLLPVRRDALLKALSLPRPGERELSSFDDMGTEHEELRARRSQFTILVAEDNPINRRITYNVLKNGGYQCILTNNGRECVDIVQSETKVDLVLMDCQMPVLDGYEALALLRKNAHTLPIIAMTGNPYEDSNELQFDAHLLKPVEPSHLFNSLDSHLLKICKPTRSTSAERTVSHKDPVDLTRFNALTQQDSALERSLVEMFLISISKELINLELSLRHLDASSALLLAHRIKGACLEIGARDLGRIASRLEQIAAEGDLDQAPALYASLKSEYGRVIDYLNDYTRREGEVHDPRTS